MLFPENPNRGKRVQELVNDCESFEQQQEDRKKLLIKRSKLLQPTIDKFLQKQGKKSYSDWESKVKLPDDLKESYKKLANIAKDTGMEMESLSIILILFSFGGSALSLKLAKQYSKVAAGGVECYRLVQLNNIKKAKADFARINKQIIDTPPDKRHGKAWDDLDIKRAQLRRAANSKPNVENIPLKDPQLMKRFNNFKKVARAASLFGAVLPFAIAGLVIYSKNEQMQKLKEATKDLLTRRLVMKYYQLASADVFNMLIDVFSLVENLVDYPQSFIDQVLDTHLDKVLAAYEKGKNRSLKDVQAQLKDMDNERRSWMNEDIDFAAIKERMKTLDSDLADKEDN